MADIATPAPVNADLTREEWIAAVERQIARTMPDQFPSGFARFTAEQYAEEGGYDAYLRGDFADGHLWEPVA